MSTKNHDEQDDLATPGDDRAPGDDPAGKEIAHSSDTAEVDVPAEAPGPESTPSAPASTVNTEAGRLGGLWVVLVVGALITVGILVFVLQNSTSAEVEFFAWSFSLPLGVLILFSAIAGALVMATFAGVRIVQLNLRARRAAKRQRRR